MRQLYLCQAQINLRNMARWSSARNHSDPDRAMHCLVNESFSKEFAPRPFFLQMSQTAARQHGILLGYTSADAATLKSTAEYYQHQPHKTIIDPDSIKTRAVPSEWEPGKRIKFQVRIMPTTRQSIYGSGEKTTEIDPYMNYQGNMPREQFYCTWLHKKFKVQGGMTTDPENMNMTQFNVRRVKRQRTQSWIPGSEVTIIGSAEVGDPAKFLELLRSGIGRHRGFGYGMVLVK